MTLVADASAVVAAIADRGKVGEWCREQLETHDLAAPHLMFLEASNILRRQELMGALPPEEASAAYDDLVDLGVDYYDHAGGAQRIWNLRATLTCYDASYVVLAEALGAPLITLDQKLSRASGPTCSFATPPAL